MSAFHASTHDCRLDVILQGIHITVIGFTLPDSEVRTNSNTAEMSVMFIWTGAGTIVGMLIIGPFYDRVNDIMLLSANLFLSGVFTALAPTWPSLTAYQALMGISSVFGSAAFTGMSHIYHTARRPVTDRMQSSCYRRHCDKTS